MRHPATELGESDAEEEAHKPLTPEETRRIEEKTRIEDEEQGLEALRSGTREVLRKKERGR